MTCVEFESHSDLLVRILTKLYRQPKITTAMIHAVVPAEKSSIKRIMTVMLNEGLIERSKVNRFWTYSVTVKGVERLEMLRGDFFERRQKELTIISKEVDALKLSISSSYASMSLKLTWDCSKEKIGPSAL